MYIITADNADYDNSVNANKGELIMIYFFNSSHCDFCGKDVPSSLAVTDIGRPCYICDDCVKKADDGEKVCLKDESHNAL